MKPSLEDERRALLEQIEASRAVYRRMLSGEPEPSVARHWPHQEPESRQAAGPNAGQRALQWMMDHPLWVAGGVAAIVLLAPRVIGGGKRVAHARARQRHAPEPPPQRTQGGTLRALLTTAAILLRDPARLRAAARFAQNAWQWVQQRRAAAESPSAPRTRISTRTTRLP